MVKEGTTWSDGKDKKFLVLHIVEQEGHTWVHYREDLGIKTPSNQCKEYSCYLESFELRFQQLP